MTESTAAQSISEIFRETTSMVGAVFEQIEWAEAEIAAAVARHPDQRDLLWHSFTLLTPTQELMSTELVYRGHVREVLTRVLAGVDTRPGTAAEVCGACSAASLVAPLRPAAAGLYGRMWALAFPDQPNFFAERDLYREALGCEAITDLEQLARRQLAVTDRRLGDIDCTGWHHGERVACRYAPRRSSRRTRTASPTATRIPAMLPVTAATVATVRTGRPA